MKFRSFLNEFDFDLSKLANLKMKEVFGFIVVEYDESVQHEVFELLYDAYKGEKSREIFSGMAYGDDKYAYYFTADKLQRCFRCWSLHWVLFWSSRYLKKMQKYESEREGELEKFPSTQSVERRSITPFKKCRYYDKENKLWFTYRFRESKEKNAPLVVYLHGNGSNGTDNLKPLGEFLQGARRIASKECSIIIPQAPMTCRTLETEPIYLTSLKSLIDSVAEKTGADKNRIYLMGGSRGGINTWQMVWQHPDYFACGIPVAGCFVEASKSGECDLAKMKDVPMWVFHSEDDTNVTIESDDFCVEKLRELGADIRYTRMTDAGHNCFKQVNKEDWLGWMFEQSLDKR